MVRCECDCHTEAVAAVERFLGHAVWVAMEVECKRCDCSGVIEVGAPAGQGPTEWDAQPAADPAKNPSRGDSFFRRPTR